MPKRIHLEAHQTSEELARRYRAARDPILRSHLQIIWLLAEGALTRAAAQATGYSVDWIRALVHRYNAAGVAGLEDARHRNPGGAALLPAAQQAELQARLEEPPDDGGLWTGAKVAAWIAARVGRPVRAQRGWEYLRKLGFRPLAPRPAHAKADPAAQAAFKKSSRSG